MICGLCYVTIMYNTESKAKTKSTVQNRYLSIFVKKLCVQLMLTESSFLFLGIHVYLMSFDCLEGLLCAALL